MAATPKEFKPMKLKLLVDNRTNKVLFAEAGKAFVDFLLGLQQIPLGSIIALLRANDVACSGGSLNQVYQSIVNLDPSHFQPGTNKDALLRPKVFSAPNIDTQLANYFVIEESRSLSQSPPWSHNNSGSIFGPSPGSSNTPSFNWGSPTPPNLGSPSESKQIGWVKDGEMFVVKDDLQIQPLSPISTIALLKTFHIKDLTSLEEKSVNIGMQEGLKILKALFESDTVLTDVFIEKTQPDCHEDLTDVRVKKTQPDCHEDYNILASEKNAKPEDTSQSRIMKTCTDHIVQWVDWAYIPNPWKKEFHGIQASSNEHLGKGSNLGCVDTHTDTGHKQGMIWRHRKFKKR